MPVKTKLTPGLQETICKLVQSGATVPHACAAAGVSWNTAKDWMTPAFSGREPYKSFCDAVGKARAKWAAGSAMAITKAGKDDWRAAAWMLEKLCPDEFASASKVELTGKDGGPIRTADISDAEIDRRLAEIAAQSASGDE